jgi:hypothetical protein
MVYMFSKTNHYWSDDVKELSSSNAHLSRLDGQMTPKYRESPEVGHKDWNNTYIPSTRNVRDVWVILPEPSKLKHFATYPQQLVRKCLSAAISQAGCCPKCKAQWARVVDQGEKIIVDHRGLYKSGCNQPNDGQVNTAAWHAAGAERGKAYENKTLAWLPTCECEAGDAVKPTVLDPFSGTGTTGVVALEMGCDYIGIELSEEYQDMARNRLQKILI